MGSGEQWSGECFGSRCSVVLAETKQENKFTKTTGRSNCKSIGERPASESEANELEHLSDLFNKVHN